MDINLNRSDGRIEVITFPDSQTNVTIKSLAEDRYYAHITISLDSADKIMLLLQTVDALKRSNIRLGWLDILYFYGARSDRQMNGNDSVDAIVTANLINSCGFQRISILDIHNLCTGLHINNFVNHACMYEYTEIKKSRYDNLILIMPDLGARKKYENLKSLDKVQCIKSRDNQGNITLEVLNAEKCIGQDCIIKDDLIDGGGTFIAIVEELRRKNIAYKSIKLECTHGIFSKGVDILTQYFDEIIVSNSYTKQPAEVLANPKITLIDVQNDIRG